MNIIISALMVLALVAGYVYYGKNTETATVPQTVSATVPAASASVKEFTMTSWMDKTADGKMSPHFSLNEIKVKKGDTVKITITNTAGTHDFVLDEFNVVKETPLNQPVVVEFVADKAGTFEYYCSKYNHRQLGQKGSLIVEE